MCCKGCIHLCLETTGLSCAVFSHHSSTVSSKVLVLYCSILLEYRRWPGCIPWMHEARSESSWGNYRTSRWLNHWWRPFEPQCCSRKLNYPHNLFVLYVHPSVVLLPLPCVCVCLWRLFSITFTECVKSSWSACTRTDLTMLHLQDITSFMVCHMTVKRLRPQLRFRDMRWCMEALVWLFGWKWYSLNFSIEHGLCYPCIIQKLDPQAQTLQRLQHIFQQNQCWLG